MPYAISNLVDGEYPGSARSVNPNDPLQEGEVLVPDNTSHQDYPHTWVWDATSGKLRQATKEEKTKFALRKKRDELAVVYTSKANEVMAQWEALMQIVRNMSGSDARFTNLIAVDDRRVAKVKELEAAAKIGPEAVRSVDVEDM